MQKMSKSIDKKLCCKLPKAAKHVALTAIADRFVKEARKERQRADEDGDDADMYWAFVESCVIDSGLLSSYSKSLFIETFGAEAVAFDFGEVAASASVERGADGETRGVSIYEGGRKTYIDTSNSETSSDLKC